MAKTDDKDALNQIRAERDRFVAFAFAASDLLLQVDHKGVIEYASGAISAVGANGILIGKEFMPIVVESDRPFCREALDKLARAGRIDPTAIRVETPDNGTRALVMGGFRLDEQPPKYYLTFTFADRLAGQEAARLARDPASGVLEKKTFEKKLEERVLDTASDEERQLTLVVLEGLKKIKETKSPKFVDEVLAKVGSILRAYSLGGDSAGQIDDEKFGVLADKSNAVIDPLLERLHSLNQQLMEAVGTKELQVQSFKIDLDLSKVGPENAGKALFHALNKFAKCNDISTYDVDSLSKAAQLYVDEAAERIDTIKDTIERRQFGLAFQVIVDLRTRQAHHFESLARIDGYMSPSDLMEMAEEIGMVEDFDMVMIQKALQAMRTKAESGWRPVVAANVSAKTLANELFRKTFRTISKPYEAVAKQLAFEISDAHKLKDLAPFDEIVQAFREEGHKCALDNIGTDPSVMRVLREVSVDVVKLDPLLCQLARNNQKHQGIVQAIVKAGEQFKFDVIAQGIEEDDHARQMLAWGVKFGQGWLFGRPTTGSGGLAYKAPDGSGGAKKGVAVTW